MKIILYIFKSIGIWILTFLMVLVAYTLLYPVMIWKGTNLYFKIWSEWSILQIIKGRLNQIINKKGEE